MQEEAGTQTPEDTVNVPLDLGKRDDVYEWCAIYKDGTELHEYNENGQHGWKDINQSNLQAFALYPQRDHLRAHVLDVTDESRPIFFRRRRIELSSATFEQVGDTSTITVLGWQKTIKGVNVASYTAFYYDGSVKVTDNPDSI